MPASLNVGLKSICSLTAMTTHAPHGRALGDGVCGLAFMAGFVELACAEAIGRHLGEGELSHGDALRISRTSQAPVEGDVTISTEIVAIVGARIGLRFECRDARRVLSAGYHERIISLEAACPQKDWDIYSQAV